MKLALSLIIFSSSLVILAGEIEGYDSKSGSQPTSTLKTPTELQVPVKILIPQVLKAPQIPQVDQKIPHGVIGDAIHSRDSDEDGVPDWRDSCPFQWNVLQVDADRDGIGDACDNCGIVENPDQEDWNSNGVGDACDDTDHDEIVDAQDNCREIPNSGQQDENGDGIGDACDEEYCRPDPRIEIRSSCRLAVSSERYSSTERYIYTFQWETWNTVSLTDACSWFVPSGGSSPLSYAHDGGRWERTGRVPVMTCLVIAHGRCGKTANGSYSYSCH